MVGKKSERVDLLRLGVFMLGIAALVVAGIAADAYLRDRLSPDSWERGVYGYCTMGVVVLDGRDTVTNVTVERPDGGVVCSFERIGKGSQVACSVNDTGVFVVRYGGHSRVVTCYEVKGPVPPSVD